MKVKPKACSKISKASTASQKLWFDRALALKTKPNSNVPAKSWTASKHHKIEGKRALLSVSLAQTRKNQRSPPQNEPPVASTTRGMDRRPHSSRGRGR